MQLQQKQRIYTILETILILLKKRNIWYQSTLMYRVKFIVIYHKYLKFNYFV